MSASTTKREIRLSPEDWFRATWRDLTPLSRPPAAPFDQAAAVARLSGIPSPAEYRAANWSRARLPLSMSREEAHFWFQAMVLTGGHNEPAKMAPRVAGMTFDGNVSLADLEQALAKGGPWLPRELWIPLVALFPVGEVTDRFLHCEAGARADWRSYYPFLRSLLELTAGFRTFVLPYLSAEEKADLRERIRPRVDPTSWPDRDYEAPPFALMLASCLGLHAELEGLVEGWPDPPTGPVSPHRQALDLVFGLGSPALVERHARRLRLRLRSADHVRAWLAHTEYGTLDWVRDSVIAEKRKSEATPLARALGLVRAPETAAAMVEITIRSRYPEIGREWLEKHPEHAVPGLLPVAAGRGRAAEAALEILQGLRRAGCEALLRDAVERSQVPEKVRSALSEERSDPYVPLDDASSPEWLRAGIAELAGVERPQWVRPGELPPLTLGGRRLGDDQVEAILAALRAGTLAEPHPLIPHLKAHLDPTALDAFAWRLCELWQQGGRRLKEMWALAATGLIGGSGCALKLGPLAKTWRERSHHQVAATAIECLRANATDAALLQLRSFSQIRRAWSLIGTAARYLEEIAAERNLTLDELEDRMVPDCGLDERGTRLFDYGARQFRSVLGLSLKPMVVEADGKLRSDLPKPTARDDAALAAQAQAEWKLLKKQVVEVAKLQSLRLEQAMVLGRRWSPQDWETLLVRHPLMVNLARSLVWGAYDAEAGLLATFRLAEDGSYADAEDEAWTPGSDVASLGIPHPLHLPEEARAPWGERLSDYEIVQPFPQIGRPVYQVDTAETGQVEATRFTGIPCLGIALVDGLERRGWLRGPTMDRGCFYTYLREFPAAGITAHVEYSPGMSILDFRGAGTQEIEKCWFARGAGEAGRQWDAERLSLADVEPVAFSETMLDLAMLTSRK